MTTYVLGPVRDHQLQHYANAVGGGELAENVHYLGMTGRNSLLPMGVFHSQGPVLSVSTRSERGCECAVMHVGLVAPLVGSRARHRT